MDKMIVIKNILDSIILADDTNKVYIKTPHGTEELKPSWINEDMYETTVKINKNNYNVVLHFIGINVQITVTPMIFGEKGELLSKSFTYTCMNEKLNHVCERDFY